MENKKFEVLPDDIIEMIKQESTGLEFGIVSLEIHFRNGKPRHWDFTKKRQIVKDNQSKSSVGFADLLGV